MTHIIPFGTSESQDFQLVDRGDPIDGTGLDVSLEIAATNGSPIDPLPTVSWIDQAIGTVRVVGVENLAVGGYRVRYQLTDIIDTIGYAPNGEKADLWHVVAVLG